MGGSWIFLSHSSKDIQIVRKIRNEFEACGHNPLAFHLKCLNSDTEEGKKEIFELLKREIDAREWYVFCESEHSEKSAYVNYERGYILGSGKSKIWSLDVTKEWNVLKKQIDKISKDLRIFVEYNDSDQDTVKPLIELLEHNDFTVWTNENDNQGEVWEDALRCGLLIMIISKHTHISALLGELEYITGNINGGETIVPVFVEGYSLPQHDEIWLRGGPSFDIPEAADHEDYASLLKYIESIYIHRILKT